MAVCCVVLPAYCEAANLEGVLEGIFAQAPHMPGVELWALVVDDNSPDGTLALLETLAAQYPRLRWIRGPKQGLGAAYQRGFRWALAKLNPALLVQMDADGQHDPAALPALVRACQAGAGAVVGSRFAPGGATPAFSRRRRWTSRAGSGLIHRLAMLPRLHDYTSGYRCLEAGVAARALAACERDQLARRGYAFQSSLIAEVLLGGAAVSEVPIQFGVRRHGRSKLQWGDYVEFALNLRRLRRRSRRGAN